MPGLSSISGDTRSKMGGYEAGSVLSMLFLSLLKIPGLSASMGVAVAEWYAVKMMIEMRE